MNTTVSMLRLPTLLAALALAGASAHAQTAILSVDFDRRDSVANPTPSPTETGFQSFVVTQNPNATSAISQVFGSYTVTLTHGTLSAISARDRGAIADNGSFTYGDLLRDGAVQLNRSTAAANTQAAVETAGVATQTTLSISGLAPLTTYQVRLWTHNRNNDNNSWFAWWNTTNGTGASASLVGSLQNVATPTYTSNTQFSVIGSVLSDAGGVIRFGQVVGSGGPTGIINGFQVIPEPSTYAMLAGALALGLVAWRRRR
jgi:hypothetical protein